MLKWIGMASAAALCVASVAFTFDARNDAPPTGTDLPVMSSYGAAPAAAPTGTDRTASSDPATDTTASTRQATATPVDAASRADAPAAAATHEAISIDDATPADAPARGDHAAPAADGAPEHGARATDAQAADGARAGDSAPAEDAAPAGAVLDDLPAVHPAPPFEARSDAASSGPAPPSVEREEDRRSSRRWRSRNRYPGPIPTPEEWEPPEGPVRIALQVGHWKTEEVPSELNGLRNGGTRWQGMHEWEANLVIARRAAELLEDAGYVVDVLPAVVPPGYRAHLFISIHADGSNDPRATGYRIAAPRRDATGRASQVVDLLERSYGAATGLPLLPTVTRRMSSYYAFNFRRYEHALHPMTIAVILETGFLTNARDRQVIVDAPERAARGIVDAVMAFPVTQLQEAAPASR